MSGEGEPPSKLIGNFGREALWGETRHPLKFLREVGLVIIIVVELLFKLVIWPPLGPFAVEFLKAEDTRHDLWGQTHVILEQDFQIAAGVTSPSF